MPDAFCYGGYNNHGNKAHWFIDIRCMKFYDREKELASLEETRRQAFAESSKLTVVMGRRRIGKTSLILKSCQNSPTVYLFVSRSNESVLCSRYAKTINDSIGVFVPGNTVSFSDIFTILMQAGKSMSFNLIIDEFQEFFNINESVYSEMQGIWDLYKDATHVNLIVSGSVHTMMHKIFMDYGQPLYGRCDKVMRLRPFSTSTLKSILADYSPNFNNDDLLALYTFTGCVPKYVSIFMDSHCYNMSDMVNLMVKQDSIFIEEGNILLIQEFGKKFGNYYSILSSIASGKNTNAGLSEVLSNTSLGGHIKRLEEDYEVISKVRPILSKENTQNVRYEISDNFLRFWFRYIIKHQDYIQSGSNNALAEIIKADYPTYSGLTLERYFRQKMSETGEFRNIGSWWSTNKNAGKGKPNDQHEIDIVGIYSCGNKVLIGEVKRQAKNFKPELLSEKVELIRARLFDRYEIKSVCLTLDDM